jgi:hypothetical protein
MALTQEQYWGALADVPGWLKYMNEWASGANGGAATHGVTGANNVGQSSYEQVLADMANRGIDVSGLAQHITPGPQAPAAQPQSIGQLDPAYEAFYQNALRDLNTGRDAELATNDYSRFLAQQRGTQQLGDLAKQWDTTREHLPASYIQRGVFGRGSGIYAQGLQDYAQNRGQAQNTAQDAYNQSLRSYDLQADKIRQDVQKRTLDLDSQRQARYQGQASSLANAKPFTV